MASGLDPTRFNDILDDHSSLEPGVPEHRQQHIEELDKDPRDCRRYVQDAKIQGEIAQHRTVV